MKTGDNMALLYNADEAVKLRNEIKNFIVNGNSLSENERNLKFNELCLKTFKLQFDNIPAYKKFCLAKQMTPDNVNLYEMIPPIPVNAFKAADIFIHSVNDAKITFKTSGTSQNNKGNSYFTEEGAEITSLAIVKNAKDYLFPDNLNTRFFLISPTPEAAPNLTMVFGITEVMKNVGTYGGRHYIGKDGIMWRELFADLDDAASKNIPVTIIGPSFAIVFMIDKMNAENRKYKLPAGSRFLDAGGFKGKSREISRSEMLSHIKEMFGVESEYCVNTLGMSELGTQYYDDNLKNHIAGKKTSACSKGNPYWARTLVADIENDLKILPAGNYEKKGALVHYDLTDFERAIGILTDDFGRYAPGGFEILGRINPGDLKGCSLTIEELLTKK